MRTVLVALVLLLSSPAVAAGSPWGFEAETNVGGNLRLSPFDFDSVTAGGLVDVSFWIPYRTRAGGVGVRTGGRFSVYGTVDRFWAVEGYLGLQQTWRTGPGSSFVFSADWVIAGIHPGRQGYLGPCVGLGFHVGSPEAQRARLQIRPVQTCFLADYGFRYTASVGVAFGPRPAWRLND